MRTPAPSQRGLGLIATMLCIAFAVAILGKLSICLLQLMTSTASYTQSVRAAALAEAGVEAARAKLRISKTVKPINLDLGDGTCRVEVSPDPKRPGCFTVRSIAKLPAPAGEMQCRLTVTVDAASEKDPAHPRVLSRKEEYRHVRRPASE